MGNYVTGLDTVIWETFTVNPLDDYGDDETLPVWQVQGANQKRILVINDSGHALAWYVEGSVDGGENYDLVVKAEAQLAFQGQELYDFTDIYTHVRILIKWGTPGGEGEIKEGTGVVKVLSQSV